MGGFDPSPFSDTRTAFLQKLSTLRQRVGERVWETAEQAMTDAIVASAVDALDQWASIRIPRPIAAALHSSGVSVEEAAAFVSSTAHGGPAPIGVLNEVPLQAWGTETAVVAHLKRIDKAVAQLYRPLSQCCEQFDSYFSNGLKPPTS